MQTDAELPPHRCEVKQCPHEDNNFINPISYVKHDNRSHRKITQRNKLELAVAEAIFDGTDDGILIIDRNYKLLYQNKATRDILGEHIGSYCYKVIQKQTLVIAFAQSVQKSIIPSSHDKIKHTASQSSRTPKCIALFRHYELT